MPQLSVTAALAAVLSTVDNNMKRRKIFLLLIAFLALIGMLLGGRFYYLEHIKYASLENEIRKIHRKMEEDFPQAFLEKAEHFGAGISIRNTYGLWTEHTPLKYEYKKAGITHPDDMSGIIMETYIREKKGVPFKLHRLIQLEIEVYKSDDQMKSLKKLADEFYIYKQHRGKMQQ